MSVTVITAGTVGAVVLVLLCTVLVVVVVISYRTKISKPEHTHMQTYPEIIGKHTMSYTFTVVHSTYCFRKTKKTILG